MLKRAVTMLTCSVEGCHSTQLSGAQQKKREGERRCTNCVAIGRWPTESLHSVQRGEGQSKRFKPEIK